MANYHQIKNAAILTPTTNTDLGSDSNRYSNVFMSGNIVMSNGVTVTSSNVIAPRIASLTYPGTETATDIAGGETITITGSGFNNVGGNPSVIIGSTLAPSSTYISSTSITFTTPALSAGTYVVYVINADGGTATFLTGLSYSGTPTWTTTAGSLGSVGSAASVNISVAATGDTPITYAVKAGSSLPSGLSLNPSTGAITGTAPTVVNSTTYNFTLTAKDSQNQPTDRTFSISVVLSPSSVDYLVVAGGGGGGGFYYAGGGAAGGLLTATGYSISAGTYTITVGNGGAAGGSSAKGGNGQNSVFGSITAYGGGGGASGAAAGNGGSGGGGSSGGAYEAGGIGVYSGSSYISAARQGYNGGSASGGGASGAGGGGGGASAAGGNGNSNVSGGAGGIGSLITLTTAFAGTATLNSTTTLNITAVSAGEIQVGTQVTGTGIPAGAYIKSLGTGTGGTGTYILSAAATATNTGVAITSSGRYFAGGGGGSCYQGSAGDGGAGGGGTGASNSTSVVSVAGAPNTGGGGGGGCHDSGYGFPASGPAAAGGSGVVIIRHADTFPTQTTTGSPTVTTASGYRIYKFTSSGSITF